MWETLADGEGNLKEVLAAPDGVHFSAGNGYGAWVTYLRNHAKYSADNAWTPAVPTQAERKTKKNKSIRDALPREGERNITDAFLQQKSRPLYQ